MCNNLYVNEISVEVLSGNIKITKDSLMKSTNKIML